MHTRLSEEGWRALKADTRPGPVQMLNLIRLRDQAEYPDARLASGLEAYAEYSRLSHLPALAVGMRILWRGRFEQVLVGPPDERWDICFIAQYPEIAAFAALMRDPAYREAMVHRQAGVADSRLIRLGALAPGSSFLLDPPGVELPPR